MRAEAGAKRYSIETDTPRFLATSLGGTPLASSFSANSILLSVILGLRPRWEHINLTGDYLWRNSAKTGAGKFRPLRPLQPA